MAKLLIYIIRLYQKVSLSTGIRNCRFYPTCSQYTVQALEKYGLIKGTYLGIKRVVKCNPFNPGGYDPLK